MYKKSNISWSSRFFPTIVSGFNIWAPINMVMIITNQKRKHNKIISIDTEKVFEKIHYIYS